MQVRRGRVRCNAASGVCMSVAQTVHNFLCISCHDLCPGAGDLA